MAAASPHPAGSDRGDRAGAVTAVEALSIAFRHLSASEQDEALVALNNLRLDRLAEVSAATGDILRSLARVAQLAGADFTVDDYNQVRRRLALIGEALVPISRIYAAFGSWRQAHEALYLTKEVSVAAIETRFARRLVGRVWRYTEATLGETLARAVADIGRVPQVAEFAAWRDRELALARARGDEHVHLPSPTPYRRRYGTWAAALLRFGYTSDEVAGRLE